MQEATCKVCSGLAKFSWFVVVVFFTFQQKVLEAADTAPYLRLWRTLLILLLSGLCAICFELLWGTGDLQGIVAWDISPQLGHLVIALRGELLLFWDLLYFS